MTLLKKIETTARKVKSVLGEPAVLRPLIIKMRRKYNSPEFRNKKIEKFIIPEIRVVFKKITGQELSDDLLKEARSIYAMTNEFDKYHAGDFDILFLYCLVRHKKPEIMIETGICSGRSSSSILEAMKKNEFGTLYSIDLPRMFEGGGTQKVTVGDSPNKYHSTLAEDASEPGWLVPEHLKGRWNKILGDSNEELPKLVKKLDHIDIFYHDSDHTYHTMTNEMTTTWPKIVDGGVLIADDATCTTAFEDFKKSVDYKVEHLYSGFAVLRK